MPVNSFENYPMTWKPVLKRTGQPLYKELARQLEDDIYCGILMPGTKLPPQRELADFLDLNVSTVSKAFRLCELKGLLSATVGSGTFVAYDALTNGRLISDTESTMISLGATVPEPSGSDELMNLFKTVLNEKSPEELFSYPSAGASAWQNHAAVQLMGYCGHEASADSILTSMGGQNGLTAVLSSLFKRGDKIVVDEHTYPGIKSAAAMFGLQLIPVGADSNGMLPDALELACQREHPSGIYLIPASHNPTTVTMPEERRDRIADVISRYGCLLIEDGTYQIMHRSMRSLSNRLPGQSVYIVTMSKVIAPGLRIAYLSVPKAYYKAVSDALYSMNIAVVPMMAELSARVIASGKFEQILESHRQQTELRNELINRYFPHDKCIGLDRDILRWLILPDGVSGAEFARRARELGVEVYPAEKFAVGKTVPQHAVRLSVCAPESLDKLEQGLKILRELYDKY